MRYKSKIATVLFLGDFATTANTSVFGHLFSHRRFANFVAVVAPQFHAFAHDDQLLLKTWAGFACIKMQAQCYLIVHRYVAILLRYEQRTRLLAGHPKGNFHIFNFI
jgi:hypothetical protein